MEDFGFDNICLLLLILHCNIFYLLSLSICNNCIFYHDNLGSISDNNNLNSSTYLKDMRNRPDHCSLGFRYVANKVYQRLLKGGLSCRKIGILFGLQRMRGVLCWPVGCHRLLWLLGPWNLGGGLWRDRVQKFSVLIFVSWKEYF